MDYIMNKKDKQLRELQVSALAIYCEERYIGDVLAKGVKDAQEIHEHIESGKNALEKYGKKDDPNHRLFGEYFSRLEKLGISSEGDIEQTLNNGLEDQIMELEHSIFGDERLRLHKSIRDDVFETVQNKSGSLKYSMPKWQPKPSPSELALDMRLNLYNFK